MAVYVIWFFTGTCCKAICLVVGVLVGVEVSLEHGDAQLKPECVSAVKRASAGGEQDWLRWEIQPCGMADGARRPHQGAQ